MQNENIDLPSVTVETIDQNDMNKIQYIYQLARTVKIFSLIDLFFSLSFMLFSPYFSLFTILYLFICYMAYVGCRDYKENLVIPYMVVNVLKNVGSILLAINYSSNTNTFIFMVLYSLLGCYITYIIGKFFINLRNLTTSQKMYIKTVNSTYVVTLL